MKKIIIITLISLTLNAMRRTPSLQELWEKTFDTSCPKKIEKDIATVLKNYSTLFENMPPTTDALRKFLKLHPRSTAFSFHAVMQFIAEHSERSVLEEKLHAELTQYDPAGDEYINLYRQLREKHPTEKNLRSFFNAHVTKERKKLSQKEKDELLVIFTIRGEEKSVQQLLLLGANIDQTIKVPRACDCPDEPPFSEKISLITIFQNRGWKY